MKKIKNEKTVNYLFLIVGAIVIVATFLSIGWSAFNSQLNIGSIAQVRIMKDIRITNFSYASSTNSAQAKYENYNVDSVTADAVLPNANSTITYNVQVTNMELPSGVKMGIYSMSGLPEGLQLVGNPTGYTMKTKICDDNDPTDCGTGAQKSFQITVGCVSSTYCNQNDNYHIFDINFDFRQIYNVSYLDINNFTSDEIIEGDNLVVNFGNNAPNSVTVDGTLSYAEGTDFDYTNGILTVYNIHENIIVTGISSSSSEGGIYNPSSPLEGTYTYSSSPGKPIVTVSNGVVTSYEFTDTSGSDMSGGAETGYIPFRANNSFEIRMHAKFPSATNTNTNPLALDIRNSSGTRAIQVGYFTSAKKYRLLLKAPAEGGMRSVNATIDFQLDANNCFDIKIVYNASTNTITVTNFQTSLGSRTGAFSDNSMEALIGHTFSGSNKTRIATDLTVYELYFKDI